jgi:UMF1 family MFS transporter
LRAIFRARNRNGNRVVTQNVANRKLGKRAAQRCGNGFQPLDNIQIVLETLPIHPIEPPISNIVGIEFRIFRDFSREFSHRQRSARNERDAVFLAVRQNFLLNMSVEQIVIRLHGSEISAFVETLNHVEIVCGNAEKSDFPLRFQRLERVEKLRPSLRPPQMALVKINAVGLQSPQTRVARAQNVIARLVERAISAFVVPEPDFCGDENVVARGIFQRFAQNFFAFAPAVHVGGVEKRDAEFDGALNGRDGFVVVDARPAVGFAVEHDRAAELPAADADFADVFARFSKFSLAHFAFHCGKRFVLSRSMAQAAATGHEKVYTRTAFSWALFDFSTTVFSMNVISRFGPLWILDEKGGRDVHVMIPIVSALILATVVNLLLAPISDALGRRAVFVRVFMVWCAVATMALGWNLTLWGAIAVLALANFGNQSVGVFWTAMLGDVTKPHSLGRISGLSVMLSYVGSIAGLLAVQPFFRIHGTAAAVFLPTAVIYLLFGLPQFFLVRDAAPRMDVDARAAMGNTWRDLAEMARKVWRFRELRLFMIALLVYMDVHSTATIYMAVYARHAMGFDAARVVFGVDEITFFLIISTIFAVAGAWTYGQLADRFDKIKLLISVQTLWAVALTIATFTPVQWPFWLMGPLIGAGMGGVWVISRALLVEYSAPDERTKIFTVFGLVGRASGVTGPVTWTLCLLFADQFAALAPHRYRVAIGSLVIEMLVAIWLVNKVRVLRVQNGK